MNPHLSRPHRSPRRIPALTAIAALAALSLWASGRTPAAEASTLTRVEDPVVLTGADVVSLNGISPGLLVAFAYDAGWQQIPVQVDERTLVDYCTIYNNTEPCGHTALQYADAATWTGADPDPAVDANDEIVFMAADAGDQPPSFSEPAGIVAGSGLRVAVSDPVHPGQAGYVYLFRQSGALDPGAGASYVTYTFSLNSGAYKPTYRLQGGGGNPEDSLVSSPAYSYHFGDRWQDDALSITVGVATGADILDRHKPMFSPGVCVRSEDSFDGLTATSPIEGAFIANKSGPVRAIRSVIGANSGPFTQRDHVFYAGRQDIRTYLRVHAISSIMDFFDYSPAAAGMTYFNNLNTGGVVIDGNPDSVAAGPIAWEAVSGPQGAVVHAGSVSTNIPGFAYTSYYLDDATPPVTQCTGDAFAYGSSGTWVNMAVPNTDPSLPDPKYLNSVRTMYFREPYGSGAAAVAGAQQLAQQAGTPLTFTIAPHVGPGDTDGDGVVDAADNCPAAPNPTQANADGDFISNAGLFASDDRTWLNSDTSGDACDTDDDNDGLTDADEASGALCAGIPSLPTTRDTDGDRVQDGAECARGTNAANPASAPALTACGPATDADGDGIADRIETCVFGSDPADANSDADGCGDARELASLNADANVNVADLGMLVAETQRVPPPPRLAHFDLTGDGSLNVADRAFLASRFGACP